MGPGQLFMTLDVESGETAAKLYSFPLWEHSALFCIVGDGLLVPGIVTSHNYQIFDLGGDQFSTGQVGVDIRLRVEQGSEIVEEAD